MEFQLSGAIYLPCGSMCYLHGQRTAVTGQVATSTLFLLVSGQRFSIQNFYPAVKSPDYFSSPLGLFFDGSGAEISLGWGSVGWACPFVQGL